MKVTYTHDGIEIDHGDRDLSAALRGGVIEMMIGENYSGRTGYTRSADINLTIEEAETLRDWLAGKILAAKRI